MMMKRNSKSGQVLVILIFTTTILLALTALGIIAATGGLRRSELQKVVDASAVMGISRYAATGNAAQASADAVSLARYNLQRLDIAAGDIKSITAPITAAGIANNQQSKITVTATIMHKTSFLQLIGIPASIPVSAVAEAVRNQAIIALVLDTSGSMSAASMAALKDGAKQFVQTFQSNFDKIAIVSFSYNSNLKRGMGPGDQGKFQSVSELTSIIDSLTSGGATNVADAIALGRYQIEKVTDAPPTAVKAIIVFTDGAPNILRARFTNINPSPPNASGPLQRHNGPNASFANEYDYSVYNAYKSNVFINKIFYSGQSNIYENHVPCHDNTVSTTNNPYRNDPRNCLNTFSYKDSKGNIWGSGISTGQMDISTNSAIMREAYDLAIRESDYAKSENITVYTIGLGYVYGQTPTPTPTPPPTPTPTPRPTVTPTPTPCTDPCACYGCCDPCGCYGQDCPPPPPDPCEGRLCDWRNDCGWDGCCNTGCCGCECQGNCPSPACQPAPDCGSGCSPASFNCIDWWCYCPAPDPCAGRSCDWGNDCGWDGCCNTGCCGCECQGNCPPPPPCETCECRGDCPPPPPPPPPCNDPCQCWGCCDQCSCYGNCPPPPDDK